MKTLITVLCLAFVLPGPGCANFATPTAVVTPAEATTLRGAALAASTTMSTAAQALKLGKITVAQWQKLAEFHDKTFQPAYNLALKAAMSDLAIAGPGLLALLAEFQGIYATFNR